MDTSHIHLVVAQGGDDISEVLAPARLSTSRTGSVLDRPLRNAEAAVRLRTALQSDPGPLAHSKLTLNEELSSTASRRQTMK